MRELATCSWIELHQNVAITSPTGVGKTYAACALAQQAYRKGYRALYRRAPRLFDELTLARADGTYTRLLARLARIDVLVIDDWGLVPVAERERRDLLEIMEDRYGQRSTVLCSYAIVADAHRTVQASVLWLRRLFRGEEDCRAPQPNSAARGYEARPSLHRRGWRGPSE